MYKILLLFKDNGLSSRIIFQVSSNFHANKLVGPINKCFCTYSDRTTDHLKTPRQSTRFKTMTMDNQIKILNLDDIISVINTSLPNEKCLTKLQLVTKYGTNVYPKIQSTLESCGSKNVLNDPTYKFDSSNKNWICKYLLLWPSPIYIIGIRQIKLNSVYDAQLGIMAWLDWKLDKFLDLSLKQKLPSPTNQRETSHLHSTKQSDEIIATNTKSDTTNTNRILPITLNKEVNNPIDTSRKRNEQIVNSKQPDKPIVTSKKLENQVDKPITFVKDESNVSSQKSKKQIIASQKTGIPLVADMSPIILNSIKTNMPFFEANRALLAHWLTVQACSTIGNRTYATQVHSQDAMKPVQLKHEDHENTKRCFQTNEKTKPTVLESIKSLNKPLGTLKKHHIKEWLSLEPGNKLQSRAYTTQAGTTATTETIHLVYEDNDSTKEVIKQFPHPKNVLHNVYSMVSQELKQKDLQVTPKYERRNVSTTESNWVCWYKMKWPSEIKCSATGSTKQDASLKAAVMALAWLLSNQKIDKFAQPVVVNRDESKLVQKQTIPVLDIEQDVLVSMQSIYDLFRTKLLSHIVEKDNVSSDDSLEEEVRDSDVLKLESVRKQRFLGTDRYLARENVKLPISDYRETFNELLENNNVIILKGEPGCGKSTRIPQYILDSWARKDGLNGKPCRIAVTQPRRIAAISLAERVANERNESLGTIVGYQVRLKSNFSQRTGRIFYCTTGILLTYFRSDPTLSNFTHIILDEAHERDVNTDLLMNLLRDVLTTNLDLKVIVMSATIDTNLFQDYFNGVPVLEIPGFTFPVKEHFMEQPVFDNNISIAHEEVVKVIKHIHKNKEEGAILVFLPGWDDISKIDKLIPKCSTVVVYCLHSRLRDDEQYKIFSRPPPGIRKIILATNIAESSITIDDVAYVVDTGIHKEKHFDNEKGVACIDNQCISQANALQRKGRAGRVKPGECFHLYTKSAFESFPKYPTPEIQRTSLTKIVLDSKVYAKNMNAQEFTSLLPCPPEKSAVRRAVEELKHLELVDESERLTPLGKTLVNFQLEPKLAKTMINSVIYKCVTPIVDIATLFSADTELFSSGLRNKESIKSSKEKFCSISDHLALMKVFEKYLEFSEEAHPQTVKKYCENMGLIPHNLITLEKLRTIHFDYLYSGLSTNVQFSDDYSDNDELVKAVLYSGVGTALKYRNWDVVKNKFKSNVNVFLTRHNQKATITQESVNYKRNKYNSNYLLYINETRSNIRRTTVIRECSLISDLAVLLFSNKEIHSTELGQHQFSTVLKSDDQVKLSIANTNIEYVCDKTQAKVLLNCREAIAAGYKYYIDKLTNTCSSDVVRDEYWNEVLSKLNEILDKSKISS